MFRRLLAVALASVAVGLMPVLYAAPAQAASATNDQIVRFWYQTVLGRLDPASDPGRSYWVGMLDRGVPREYVLGSIVRSHEYAELEVGRYYNRFLYRAPDPGARYWIDQTADHDMAWEWVAQNILASPERQARAHRTSQYVNGLYLDVLGRFPGPADSGAVGYWSNRYEQVGALTLVREIWYTDEAVRHRLNLNYQFQLGRDVDQAGLDYWVPRERQSDITVQVDLASTAEYADRASHG
jgi:hypothetical protein